jgi:hypothetical protein
VRYLEVSEFENFVFAFFLSVLGDFAFQKMIATRSGCVYSSEDGLGCEWCFLKLVTWVAGVARAVIFATLWFNLSCGAALRFKS